MIFLRWIIALLIMFGISYILGRLAGFYLRDWMNKSHRRLKLLFIVPIGFMIGGFIGFGLYKLMGLI